MRRAETRVLHPGLVEPRFRDKPISARREERERRVAVAVGTSQPRVEITGEYGDTRRVRVGDRCWLAPSERSADTFDARIWTADLGCSSRDELRL